LFTINVGAPVTTDTVISYLVSGSAVLGVDYSAFSTSVTILAGSSSASVSVPPLGGGLSTPTVVILTLTGSSDSGVQLPNPAPTALITILDFTTASIAGTTDADKRVPSNGLFTITLAGTPTAGTTIAYTATGTATSGSDYQPVSGTVTFAAGQASATVSVIPITPAGGLPTTLTLSLASASGVAVALGTPVAASIQILDNAFVTIAATTNTASKICEFLL
jgi:hypothetical protein